MRNILSEDRYQPRDPMDLIAIDLFEIKGCNYLVVLDVFTGYPWMKQFRKSQNTHQVTEALNKIFLTWGYPKPVKSDRGGHYRTEFKQFQHVHNPQHHKRIQSQVEWRSQKRGINNQITNQESGTGKR